MLRSKQIYIILIAIGITIIAESCATNTQQINRQQMAYENCMKEKIKEFPNVNVSEAKMTAHFICNMETGFMDERYFDCIPIATQMFSSDGVKDPKSSATAVCKYYSQACRESQKHPTCVKNYIADEYQSNPNLVYPGSQLKKANYGSTLLIELISFGEVDTLEAVIKRGADVNETMGGNWTPLAEARSKGNRAMVELLKRYGAK